MSPVATKTAASSPKRTSLARRLYFVVGIMACLIAGELFVLKFTMEKLSAVRAFVDGEGLWSKAQKNSIISLSRFGVSKDPQDYQDFLDYLKIPAGDRKARLELQKPNPDLEIVRQGFLEGQIHPDDIDGMIKLLRGFSWISYLSQAIGFWTQGDELLIEYEKAGAEYREIVTQPVVDQARLKEMRARLRKLNEDITAVETGFSQALGEGSRWLEKVVITLLFVLVLTVECVGLGLTFVTTRRLSRGLAELNQAAQRLGKADFSQPLNISSHDEIGNLAHSVNQMGSMLQTSYRDLEDRVHERTLELEKLADENARLYEEAKEALQARDEFLSIASHELKTPLSALFLQLQLLDRHLKDGELKPDLIAEKSARALAQGKKLTILINELLDLTRVRAGRLELMKEKVDLKNLLQDAIAQMAGDAEKAGVKIKEMQWLSLEMACDPVRITQVIVNLLSNAIKYGDGKPVELFLSRDGNEAKIEVVDQGKGIEKEKQAGIFKRFERAVEDHGISGLGLGLYITRQLVEAHGGSISVQSSPGQGSTFTVRLPFVYRSSQQIVTQ